MKLLISIFILLLLFVSCYSKREWNFSEFLINSLNNHGSQIDIKQDYPVINTSWKYKKDEEEIIILVERNKFDKIDSLLRNLFGKPKLSTDKNMSGYPHRVYSAEQAGAVIQCLRDDKNVEIVILRKCCNKKENGTE